MNIVLKIGFILVVGFLLGAIVGLPWWSLLLVAYLAGMLRDSPWWANLILGLVAGFVLWGGMAYVLDIQNGHILSSRLSELFLKESSPAKLVLLTGVLGAFISGLGVLAGGWMRTGLGMNRK